MTKTINKTRNNRFKPPVGDQKFRTMFLANKI